ncbi:Hypothetical protein NTJ_04268 [Nesidiocoris tenuis]|uniref:Protein quiver n=1 Tax=Nesidiocoris tenuis TaxID=355587 RepID=A0ABN7AGS5_9HEMI|nr:Hypothetical protein NTJ_04268 [Nesidiocoris tenuis]
MLRADSAFNTEKCGGFSIIAFEGSFPTVLWDIVIFLDQAGTMQKRYYIVTLSTCILMNVLAFALGGIQCFKCVSLNGNNKACDDPFHNNYTVDILESPCLGGRKGRNGLFPATACIKLSGTYEDSGDTITIRGCALDSGTLTTDTEIIRMSHCGSFYYEDRYVRGCLQSCDDADACNSAIKSDISAIMILLTIIFQVIYLSNF